MAAVAGRPWTVPAGGFTHTTVKDSSLPEVNDGPNAGSGMANAPPSSHSHNHGAGASGGEVEVDELHRAYRTMELTRKQNNEESANTLRMQRQQIEKLKKDNDRLKEDLALETRQARQANNVSGTAQIAKLQDQGDIYTRKIETEKRRLEDLDKQIKRLQQSILAQRKEMGGSNGAGAGQGDSDSTRESSMGVQKQIRILENRLDKALVKFNEALAHNKGLREQIDNLRRERVVFDGIYAKLARELQRKKAHMHQLMGEANRAVEARQAAQAEMVALKAAADREQVHFEEEWRNLGALIEKDRRSKEMQRVGGQPSSSSSGSVTSGSGERSLVRGVDPTLELEQSLRKRVTKGAWGIATDKASIHLSMEKVQAYEEAFAAIQKATRITDIDSLVHEFVTAEDANFALFNYVNDLANEVERVEEQQNHVREQLAKLRAGQSASLDSAAPPQLVTQVGAVTQSPHSSNANADTDAERKKLLAELDAKLHKNLARARASEESLARGSQTLQALKAGVGDIFARLGCGESEGTAPASEQLLGGHVSGVTESNIMQYLGLIEARTNELLQAYQRHREEGGVLTVRAPGRATSREEEEELQRTRRADAASHGSSTATTARAGAPSSNSPYGSDALSIHAPSAATFDDDAEDADGDLADEQPITSHEQLRGRRHEHRGDK